MAESNSLERKVALFGSGTKPNGLFQVGPHNELVGLRVDEVGIVEGLDVTVDLDQEKLYNRVNPESTLVPSYVTGRVFTAESTLPQLNLAIAINETISAVTRTFPDENLTRFAALVPETAFRAGKNDVEIFVVSGGVQTPRLYRTQSTEG
jgi:hypothetical protein